MKKIFIVRHGESEANANERGLLSKEGKYVIDSKFKLTEKGRYQVEETGAKIAKKMETKNYSIYISPYERTRQTARILDNVLFQYEKNLKRRVEDPRLIEQDFGDFDFQFQPKWKKIDPHSYKVNQAKYNDMPGRFFARLPTGENLLDVYNRMSLFVITRLERDDTENIIIVTHGYAERVLLMYLLDLTIEEMYDIKLQKNASVIEVCYDEETGKYTKIGNL